jgi:hypothetical protein
VATATFGVTLVALEEGLATAAVVGMATAVDTAAAAAPLPRRCRGRRCLLRSCASCFSNGSGRTKCSRSKVKSKDCRVRIQGLGFRV